MADQNQTPTRTSKRVRVVLFVSLALNLLVVGVVAGALIKGAPSDRKGPSRNAGLQLPYIGALDAQDRKALSRKLRAEARNDRPTRGAWRADFETAVTLLRAEPFDPAAFEAHVSDQFDSIARRGATGRKALVAYIADMSSQERAAFADRLQERLKKGPRRKNPAH